MSWLTTHQLGRLGGASSLETFSTLIFSHIFSFSHIFFVGWTGVPLWKQPRSKSSRQWSRPQLHRALRPLQQLSQADDRRETTLQGTGLQQGDWIFLQSGKKQPFEDKINFYIFHRI